MNQQNLKKKSNGSIFKINRIGGNSMGLFGNQLLDVIEWNETRNDVLFWKWKNSEIKKNSRLIIRPGQDAIFMHNGFSRC